MNVTPNENMDAEPEGTLPPKAPELLRKLKWLRLYGPRHKWYVLAAATFSVASIMWFGLGGSLTQFPQTGRRIESPNGTASVHQPDSDAQEVNQSDPDAQEPANRPSITLAEYFQRIDELEDRFLEKREFLESLNGKLVLWRGYVYNVNTLSYKIGLMMSLDSTFANLNGAYVVFDKSWKTKLYSLQKGDFVEIEGVYKLGTASLPTIHGVNLTVVHPNSS